MKLYNLSEIMKDDYTRGCYTYLVIYPTGKLKTNIKHH